MNLNDGEAPVREHRGCLNPNKNCLACDENITCENQTQSSPSPDDNQGSAAQPESASSPGDDQTSFSYGGGRYLVTPNGIYFQPEDEGHRHWICSPVKVLAKTRDANSREWGRLIECVDADGTRHQWAMPMEMLQGDGKEVRCELARLGVNISPAKPVREQLAIYLNVWPTPKRARCVEQLGWCGSVYVTPIETIGQDDEIVVFQNVHATEPATTISGSVDEWRESVASLAAGNSRLVFAICIAFAGPLLEIAGEDSGGFHFRGASSSGKTTTLKVAASVWGSPKKYTRLWRATSNGLEGLAALHNDGLLILDELSQIDPREAGASAYLLANGQGKTRMTTKATVRRSARWRLLFLSAGEESLIGLMARVGIKTNVGQEIRLADIEVDAQAGMGAFEDLHGQPDPNKFAQRISNLANQYHGAIGLEWLRRLVKEDRFSLASFVSDGVRQFVEEVTPANAGGQVMRVARRFGLVAVAGEIASHFRLTGWVEGEATNAAQKCFEGWLESFGGTGNREERAILAHVRSFFETHGASRFGDVTDKDLKISNRAGYYRTDEAGGRTYLVLPGAYKRDVCGGYDPKTVTRVLRNAGWLDPDKDGSSTQKPRLPGMGSTRCYVFNARMWESDL